MKAVDLELLRPLWTPKSLENDESCTQSLKLWLMDGSYNVINAPPLLSLHCQGDEEIKKSLSLDAFRFSTHAAQTVYELQKSTAYSSLTSWRVIQTYYAAYYAAHAILRFFGKSFSHLESGHVKFLRERCTSEAAFNPSLPISYYLLTYNPEDKRINFLKCDESHKDLWKNFGALLREISNACLTLRASNSRQQDLSNKFSDLADALTLRGKLSSSNWLSVVRNEVNYKSLHGTWFPFSKSTPSFDTLMAKVKDWRNCSYDFENPNLIRANLERFFITSFIIIDLALAISFDFQKIIGSPGNRSKDFSRLINMSAAA